MISRFITVSFLTSIILCISGLFLSCSAFEGGFEIDGKGYTIKDGVDLSNLVFRNVRMKTGGDARFAHASGGTSFDEHTRSAIFTEFRFWGDVTLENVKFDNSDLRNAIFAGVRFKNCSFRGANLSGLADWTNDTFLSNDNVIYDFATYQDCDFTDAIIDSAYLVGITGENFRLTDTYKRSQVTKKLIFKDGHPLILRNSNLDETSFKDYTLINIAFWNTSLKDCDFSGAYLDKVSLGNVSREQLLSTKNYQIGVFIGVTVAGDFTDIGFSSMSFTNCDIGGNLANANFTDAVIINSRIFGDSLTIDQVKSTWNYKHGRMAGIKLPEDIQKALDAEKEQQ